MVSIGEILVSIAVMLMFFSGKLGKMNIELDSKKKDEKEKDDAS